MGYQVSKTKITYNYRGEGGKGAMMEVKAKGKESKRGAYMVRWSVVIGG